MVHMAPAAIAARCGRDSPDSGGGFASSRHTPVPVASSVTASATVSAGLAASAFTATGNRQAITAAMNAIRTAAGRDTPGQRDIVIATNWAG